VLELREAASGHLSRALFKPRAQGDFDGWHRVPIERVAYSLSRLLGMDVVPPCVYRTELEVAGCRFPEGGALVHFVEGVRQLAEVEPGDWGVDKRALLSDTRILVRLLPFTSRARQGARFVRAMQFCAAARALPRNAFQGSDCCSGVECRIPNMPCMCRFSHLVWQIKHPLVCLIMACMRNRARIFLWPLTSHELRPVCSTCSCTTLTAIPESHACASTYRLV
jgi:hypothetical protein